MFLKKLKFALQNCLKDPSLYPLIKLPTVDIEQCLKDYMENLRISKHICDARGAVYRVYLQPDAGNKRNAPTKFDMSACAHLSRRRAADDRDYGELVTTFLRRVEQTLAEDPSVTSMRTMFSDYDGEIYFDHAHFSDLGYDRMARFIAEDIVSEERK